MDKLTIIGLFIAVLAIFSGQILEGGSIEALLDASAFVIVVGGSVGAVMVQSHAKTFVRAIKITKWIFTPPKLPVAEAVQQIADWSFVARREGLLGLEKKLDEDIEPFVLRGLNMLVDGNDAKAIREAMFVELDVNDKHLLEAAKVYESIGGYSPTLGIVGAVLGLIHVMGNLSNPELLGAGIATAFVATIYGVGFANLFFIPIYHKLRAIIAQQSQYREMLIEGIACIAEGENPRVIEGKLNGYLVG
jgi:chemotaxis protein MotA